MRHYRAMPTLSEQVAIVTGGGRGIGRAVAEALASEGMSVVLLARSRDQLEEARASCEALGGRCITAAVDVSDHVALAHAVEGVESDLGPIDLLVSNAGTQGPHAPLWETGYDAWWETIRANLGGAIAGAAAVLPGMVTRGRGRVVHMNSLIGTRDDARFGAYGVSKAALLRLGGVLSASLAGTGVTVLDVSPGLVRTAMTDGLTQVLDIPDAAWTPVERVASLVVTVAQGHLDALSGRLVHAQDDWLALADRAEEIVAADGRALRLTPGWPADPLLT